MSLTPENFSSVSLHVCIRKYTMCIIFYFSMRSSTVFFYNTPPNVEPNQLAVQTPIPTGPSLPPLPFHEHFECLQSKYTDLCVMFPVRVYMIVYYTVVSKIIFRISLKINKRCSFFVWIFLYLREGGYIIQSMYILYVLYTNTTSGQIFGKIKTSIKNVA